MRDVLRGNLRRKPGRMIATVIAIMMSVAFVVLTLSLPAALTGLMRQIWLTPMQNTQVVANCHIMQADDIDAGYARKCDALAEQLRELPEVSAADFSMSTAVEVVAGSNVVHTMAFNLIGEAQRPQKVTKGTLPTADNEIAVTPALAKGLGVDVGSDISVSGKAGSAAKKLTISGLFEDGPFDSQTVVVSTGTLVSVAHGSFYKSFIFVSGPEGADAVKAAVQASAPVKNAPQEGLEEFQTTQESLNAFLDEQGGGALAGGAVAFTFALIALIVAGMVVTLTFQVLVVQRTRELALLRCIGASQRQVRRLVIAEALIVSLISALLGAGLGALLTWTLFPLMSLPVVPADLTIPVLAGIGVGIALGLLCSISPARRATRVAPLAALRPVEPGSSDDAAHRIRWTRILAVLIFLVGAGGLVYALSSRKLEAGIGFGGLLFIGVVSISPVLVPLLVRALTVGWKRASAPAELAVANVERNRSRTVATAAALIVGIALVTTVVVGRFSVQRTAEAQLDKERPLDLIAVGTDLGADELATVEQLKHVEKVALGDVAYVKVGGDEAADTVPVLAFDASINELARSPLTLPGDGELISYSNRQFGFDDGAKLTITQAEKSLQLKGLSRHGIKGTVGWVSPATMSQLDHQPGAIVIRLDNSVASGDVKELTKKLEGLGSQVQVFDGASSRLQWLEALEMMMVVILALLGASVVIAAVGVSNTLALSVAERRRESGLLRALGFTRRQMRRMISLEALLTTGVAVVIGLALGLTEGMAGAYLLVRGLDWQFEPDPAWPWLLGVVVVAALTALIAALLPARQASRTSPLEAIGTE